jgi:type II secretory pathway pseudopilin PulG
MKRGQVWVETVIYTLIGLVLIGIVLGLVGPKINQYRDREIIEQSISSLILLDSKIQEVRQAPGNKRFADVGLKKGALYLNKESDEIIFELKDSNLMYSEPDVNITNGAVKVLTQKSGKHYLVKLSLNVSADLDFDENENLLKISAAATPYRFFFENKGFGNDGREIIFFSTG